MKMKIWLIAFLLVGCSTVLVSSPRHPNSKIYSCHFEEMIKGEKILFHFTPEDQSLVINSKSLDDGNVLLEESDFSEGGFVYKSEAESRNWDLKLEFVSFKTTPLVKLTLNKSPLSNEIIQVSKTCIQD